MTYDKSQSEWLHLKRRHLCEKATLGDCCTQMLSRRVLSGCCCCCSWDRNGKGTSSLIAYAIGQRTLIVGEGSLYSWPPVDQQINHCTAGLNHCTAGLQLTHDENTHRWGRFTVQLASSLASLDLTNSDTSPNGEVLCLGPWLSKVHFIKPPTPSKS